MEIKLNLTWRSQSDINEDNITWALLYRVPDNRVTLGGERLSTLETPLTRNTSESMRFQSLISKDAQVWDLSLLTRPTHLGEALSK